jgi:catechol 2,3-dioxygenase-like lactoylglutathione lyase family enzyme
VTDLEKSFKFYRDILGFKPLVKWDKGAIFW